MSAFDSLSKLFPLIGDEGMFAMQINYWISSIFTCLPNLITISGFAGKRRSGRGKYKIIAEIVGWPHIIQNWIRGQNAFNQSSPWWPWEWYFVHGHIITGYLQNISKRSKYLQLQAKFVNGIALLRPLSNYRICCLCRKNSRIFISITPEHTHLPIAYKLVWQKKKITLWLLFQCASRNVRLTGRERTCGPSHSTAFLPRFGLTVDFIFWFMFALKVWILKLALHPYLLFSIHRDHHL